MWKQIKSQNNSTFNKFNLLEEKMSNKQKAYLETKPFLKYFI